MKFFISFLFITSYLFAQSNEKFKIVQPQTKTVYKEAFASITVTVNKKSKTNKIVFSSKNKSYTLKVNKKRKTYCKSVDLLVGNNKYTVTLYNDNKILGKKDLNLFYYSEVFEDGVTIPKGYNKYFFHKNKNEKFCSKCHDMKIDSKSKSFKVKKGQKVLDVVYDNVKESNCFDCHKPLLSRKNSHSPSINLLCTKCHTGKTSVFNKDEKKKSKFLVPDPIDSTCFSCHEAKNAEKWYEKKYKHGPVMTGRCTKCHNPHSSDNIFFLKKPIWKLCTTCHDEKAKGKHVLGSFVYARNKGAHPTKDRKDPSRPTRELVCSSCHNPHGSEGYRLLRMKGKSIYGVCKRCHTK